jgi:hypothetical protein
MRRRGVRGLFQKQRFASKAARQQEIDLSPSGRGDGNTFGASRLKVEVTEREIDLKEVSCIFPFYSQPLTLHVDTFFAFVV